MIVMNGLHGQDQEFIIIEMLLLGTLPYQHGIFLDQYCQLHIIIQLAILPMQLCIHGYIYCLQEVHRETPLKDGSCQHLIQQYRLVTIQLANLKRYVLSIAMYIILSSVQYSCHYLLNIGSSSQLYRLCSNVATLLRYSGMIMCAIVCRRDILNAEISKFCQHLGAVSPAFGIAYQVN